MKKIQTILISTVSAFILSCIMATPTQAVVGDMGFFGGISSGTRLPKTTERMLLSQNNRRVTRTPMDYTEMVFLDGIPREANGQLTTTLGTFAEDSQLGTTTERYVVTPLVDAEVSLNRNISFNVNYRRHGNQLIKDYQVATWAETIDISGTQYSIDPRASQFTVSVIEDQRAGITFYRGDLSIRAVYRGDDPLVEIIDERDGSFYGFRSAWSAVETHRVDSTITNTDGNDTWSMQLQIRPSVSVNKFLQFVENEPSMISFGGNFREVMQNTSGLEWNIFHRPQQFSLLDDEGRATVASFNTFEQLIAPNLNFLRGHAAEFDISRLYGMQILNGEPSQFRPEQAMTRGKFTEALARAIGLTPVEPPTARGNNRNNVQVIIFPDVPTDRSEYPWIMAARNVGLASGRDNGRFGIDEPISREEAIALMVRAIGLEDMGIYPVTVTPFTDNHLISDWALREMYVADWIGLVSGDANSNIRPRDMLTNAEGAAIINRLIEYMRFDLAMDYTEHIINFTN